MYKACHKHKFIYPDECWHLLTCYFTSCCLASWQSRASFGEHSIYHWSELSGTGSVRKGVNGKRLAWGQPLGKAMSNKCVKTCKGAFSSECMLHDTASRRQALLRIGPKGPCPDKATQVSDDTLVMHFRSGDLWRLADVVGGKPGAHGPQNQPQPPCAFYEAAFLNPLSNGKSYSNILAVTEPDMKHPCIEYFQQRYNANFKTQSLSVTQDACTIVQASHVALSMGTFALTMARTSTQIKRLHIPFCDTLPGTQAPEYTSWWCEGEAAIKNANTTYEQVLYGFTNYTGTGFSAERMNVMKKLPLTSVQHRSLPSVGTFTDDFEKCAKGRGQS